MIGAERRVPLSGELCGSCPSCWIITEKFLSFDFIIMDSYIVLFLVLAQSALHSINPAG